MTEAGEPSPRSNDRPNAAPTNASAHGDPSASWLGALREIIAAFEASDATELELRTPPLRIALRRQPGGLPVLPALPEAGPEDPTGLHLIRCPLTGVWYDAPSPGAQPYVSIGDLIEVGTTIGLIETMKVFNEVTSDIAGVVRQIMVHRGDLVIAHTPLLAVEPGGAVMAPTPTA